MKHLFLFFVAVTLCIAVAGCESLAGKAVAVGSGVDALKVETTGSVSSGTFLPNVIAGGAVNTLATAPSVPAGTLTQVVYVHTRRNSFFSEVFGIDASTESVSYIGSAGESADDTAKRLTALTAATVSKVNSAQTP